MPEENSAPEPQQTATPDQPEETPEDAPQKEGTSTEEESFTDSYNPNAVEDETARAELEKAYKQLQADYTTKRQAESQQVREAEQAMALVEALRDPNNQAQALQALGLELADQEQAEGEEGYVDPDDRLAKIEEYLAYQEQEQAQAQNDALEEQWLTNEVDALQKKESVEFSDGELGLLLADATSNRFEDGRPDLEGAYGRLKGAQETFQERYVASKKAPKVGTGTQGNRKVDLSDEDQRQELMAEIMESEASEQ